VQAARVVQATQQHAWLSDLLFARTPATTWAAAGSLPAGFDHAGQMAVIPAGLGRTFMVSLTDRIGASSALTSYNSLRSGRTRIARRMLGLGLRAGLAQPLLRDKIDLGVAAGIPSGQQPAELSHHLAQLLHRSPVTFAVSGGSGPYRKPVLQVFDASGAPVGYVKVGWNDWTREAVRREAAALQACARHSLGIGVPVFRGLSTWQGLDLLVTAPLPPDIRALPNGSGLPDATVLSEICALAPGFTGELAASPWWAGLRSRIGAGTAAQPALERLVEGFERAYGRVPLSFGAWHGDLVPWNLGRCGSRLYAWDWEGSTADVPAGFDAVHFYFQVAFIAHRRPLAEAVSLAAEQAGRALTALGVPERDHRLLSTLHLLEQAVRHEEARRATGDVDDRFYPAVTGVLECTLASAGPRTVLDPARKVA
jgi:hypothetical protein